MLLTNLRFLTLIFSVFVYAVAILGQFTLTELEEGYNSSAAIDYLIDFDGDGEFDFDDDEEQEVELGHQKLYPSILRSYQLPIIENQSAALKIYYLFKLGIGLQFKILRPPRR